jgi:hypothetical protein
VKPNNNATIVVKELTTRLLIKLFIKLASDNTALKFSNVGMNINLGGIAKDKA